MAGEGGAAEKGMRRPVAHHTDHRETESKESKLGLDNHQCDAAGKRGKEGVLWM